MNTYPIFIPDLRLEIFLIRILYKDPDPKA
jgi:hypothetical protein